MKTGEESRHIVWAMWETKLQLGGSVWILKECMSATPVMRDIVMRMSTRGTIPQMESRGFDSFPVHTLANILVETIPEFYTVINKEEE